jgi:hypothetical protein
VSAMIARTLGDLTAARVRLIVWCLYYSVRTKTKARLINRFLDFCMYLT